MNTKDPYQVLGVGKNASQDEIKNAYRNLAKKFHPDLNPANKTAENKFKDISYAYERIGTPEARVKYDQGDFEEGPPGDAKGGFGGFRKPGGGPFYRRTQETGQGGRYTFSFGEGIDEDLFQSIFGGRDRRDASGFRGEDRIYQMQIDLRDSVLGAEKEITLPSGKRLAVKIPRGLQEGTRLKLAGHGAPGESGGPPGDAYVEIHFREDLRFKREGDQLIFELPISITEAVFGAEVKTPTLDGEVLMKIPPKSNTGKKLKLSGKGLFNPRTKQRGDQLVVLRVMLPETIDSELEAALRNWQSRHSYNPRERGAA